MSKGFVYVLISPNSDYVKIGGTGNPISQRIRQINGTTLYVDHGPWELSDFLHITDWRLVEGAMHKHFHKNKVHNVEGTRELFTVTPHAAREQLRRTESTLRIGNDKTEELFKNSDVRLYLYRLFQFSGLFGNIDIQGAWTLSVLPHTAGGRWFTLNIGSHEVAFSTRKSVEEKFSHYILLDRLILDYPETVIWIGHHNGFVDDAEYATARERAVLIRFDDSFANAERIFKLPGLRRAMIAYWSESLADLRERDAKSSFSRFHSYDAVAELLEYRRSAESVFLSP